MSPEVLVMAVLFDNDDSEATLGFKNLKAADETSIGGKIRLGAKRFATLARSQDRFNLGRDWSTVIL
jgi:hypothetical protein